MVIAKIETLSMESYRIDRNANYIISITRIFPKSSQPFQQELLELLGPVFSLIPDVIGSSADRTEFEVGGKKLKKSDRRD